MRTHQRRRLPGWVIGLIMVVVLAVGSVIAYTKELPWSDEYEVTAVFSSGQKLRSSNPVRIAGVNVGKVTEVELLGDSASSQTASASGIDAATDPTTGVKVTMALDEAALPLHEDALFKIRPRLFLEGNYFIDVQPGSPSAPVVEEGHAFPVNRTSHSVQLDQVLTTLQSDVRADLQTLLQEFGAALSVHGGADGLRALNRTGPNLQYSAQVAESFRGTQEGDLPGMISGLSRVLGGLSKDQEALSELITNFSRFSGSFAAQDVALGNAIEQLPDTLAAADPFFDNLNASLPQLRAFAREALPGVRTSPESLRASRPFIEQLRLLVSPPELQGLVADLRPTVPRLHRLGRGNLGLFRETRQFSSCFNEVIVPWSKSQVDVDDPGNLYPHEPGDEHGPDADTKVFEQGPYGFTATAVESRSGDSNGQNLRVLGGSGAFIGRSNIAGLGNVVSLTPLPVPGAVPSLDEFPERTPFKPNRRCETQEPPNLTAQVFESPTEFTELDPSMRGIGALSGPGADDFREGAELVDGLTGLAGLADLTDDEAKDVKKGQRFFDEIGLSDVNLEQALGVEAK
ncbi:MAG: MlaD family protein [Actinomycetota bacterium]|nr:MlaD family protein [Actinomycetota bacterium]